MEKKRFSNRRWKKVCQFSAEELDRIDYKDVDKLKVFISERGKILPRRATGASARHQRAIVKAIKRARQVALLPYIADK